MADPTEEPPENPEEGGGPVKTFLDHLEDLRWMLVKSGAALLIGLIICLYATPQIIWLLKQPLRQAALISIAKEQRVMVRFGTNTLTTFETLTNRIGPVDLGSNRFVRIQIDPVLLGTNMVLGLHTETPTEAEMMATATDLVYLDPSAPFLSGLHLALYGGILLAAPFIFYFIAQFILPALKVKEKKYALRACAVGVGLFLTGVCFCYFFVLARALKYAEAFAIWMGVKVPEWRAETYFSFVTKFMLGMGLGFELPVVLLALVKIGVLDYARLKAMRRYMIVVNLILGALLTTPEVFTQVVMAVVLQILYEISVMIAWYWERQERKREAMEI
ncbi:MAG: twin-arginine translocase subunit TatC [Verrucomicrobiota bacterium]